MTVRALKTYINNLPERFLDMEVRVYPADYRSEEEDQLSCKMIKTVVDTTYDTYDEYLLIS